MELPKLPLPSSSGQKKRKEKSVWESNIRAQNHQKNMQTQSQEEFSEKFFPQTTFANLRTSITI